MGIGRPTGCDEVLVRGICPSVSNIFPDRVSEQDGFLRHDGQLSIQTRQTHVPEILVVDGNPSLNGIIKPVQQIRNRAFPRAGGADQRHGFARLYLKGEINDHRMTGIISKTYVIKSDVAVNVRQGAGFRGIRDVWCGIKQFKDALHGPLPFLDLGKDSCGRPERAD